ncbi:MAG: hypothetical protein LWW82_13550 [Comamonadaceae bacterium]|nr:hypothetical protein [Comamonadaceae bacterium]
MRRLLFTLLALLLALQGLLGSAMASGGTQAPAHTAPSAHSACHQATPANATPHHEADASTPAACNLCGLCHHAPALGAAWQASASTRPGAPPRCDSPRWHSAPLALALKPPIV